MKRAAFIGALLFCALGIAEAGLKRPRRFQAMGRTLASGPLQIPVVISVGASYTDSGSSQGLSFYTTPQLLSDGTTTGAYWVSNAGVVEAAVEPVGVGIEFPIGAIQRTSAILDRRMLLVEDSFPGTRISGYSTTQILTDLDTAAAWAASNGWEICPAIFNDNSGCYNEQAAADPFSVCQADLQAHETAIEAHIASRVAAGTAGYAAGCTNVRLMVNQGGAQGFGSVTPVRHPYVNDFVTWAASNDNVDLCAQFHWISIGADNLHPDQAGGIDLADAYGRCWARTIARVATRAAVLEAVTVIDADTIRATFASPCRLFGGCANDPPVTLETTALVGQTSDSVLTYGFHFYLGGVLQTPGAVSSVTLEPCPVPAQSCDVTLDFATLPDFDEVSYADTAIGLGEDVPAGGGGNFLVELTGAECGADTPCADWTVGNVLAVNSYDAGPDAGFVDSGPDAGFPDSGADAGTADSGVDSGTPDAGFPDSGPADAGFPDSGVAPDTGVVETQAQFANFAGTGSSPIFEMAGSDATWAAAEAMCAMAWTEHTLPQQEAWLAQFNVGVSDLRVWLGYDYGVSGEITFATGFSQGGSGTTVPGTTRHHLALCFEAASSGPGTIRIWVDGVAETVTVNGTLPSVLTLAGTPDVVRLPETVWDGTLDEVWIGLWSGASAQSLPIGETQVREHYCTTRSSLDADLAVGGGCAAGGYNRTRGYLATLSGCEAFYPFEGDTTSVCGSLSFAPTGTIPLGSYP